jgi:hypothetical protein
VQHRATAIALNQQLSKLNAPKRLITDLELNPGG